jgi:hypothetical protein
MGVILLATSLAILLFFVIPSPVLDAAALAAAALFPA